MPDVREVYDMVTKQRPPRAGALERQWERQHRSARNRRVGAFLVAAIIASIAVVIAVAVNDGPRGDERTPATLVPPTALAPGDQDAAVVALDGEAVGAIRGIPEDAYALTLSPDGTTVAFITAEGATIPQLATVEVGGSEMQIHPTPVIPSSPAWSPRGDLIAFEATVEIGTATDIYVMRADGSGMRQLTDDPSWGQFPQWTPDGSTIVYQDSGPNVNEEDAQFSSTSDIWEVPATGGRATPLFTRPGNDAHPSIAPDGTRIAYHRADGLWIADLDGSDAVLLVSGRTGGFTPRWSPDGATIAYTNYSPIDRPFVSLAGTPREVPLVTVHVVDVSTGARHAVGDVGMATDSNVPVWWGETELLIRRVGY